MEQRQNVVIGEDGKLLNLREDLEKECRYISQTVTISKTQLWIDGPYLKFKMTFQEREPIEILLEGAKESKIREIFSMLEVKFQEELNGKSLMCYSGIDNRVWAIGATKKDWIVNLYEKCRPYLKKDMIDYYRDELPNDEEWKAFCQKQCQE